jgi:hypothetical protein
MTNLEMEREKVVELQENRRKVDAGKYESKYRDLKVGSSCYSIFRVNTLLMVKCPLRNHSGYIERRPKKYSLPNNKERLASCRHFMILEPKMPKYHTSKT